MGLGDAGYIFTFTTALMIMIILSLTLFYTEVSSPSFEDATNRMSLNELHYYVESLKKDASRAVAISSQRGAAYAINHVITHNETFANYSMKNCTGLTYYVNGSEAAMAELMICGTLGNAVNPPLDIERYMENNTILNWTGRISANQSGLPYNISIRLRNMTMALYDSWHYVVFSEFDLVVEDKLGKNRFSGHRIPVTSVVDISMLEDPMQYVNFGVPPAIRLFTGCEKSFHVNGTVFDDWIEKGCYQSTSKEYNSPSFLDRLEGNKNLSLKFVERSDKFLTRFNYTMREIGLESFLNIDLLTEYNVSVNNNLSQVDYMYWNGAEGRCSIAAMELHPDFRLNSDHALRYRVFGLICDVDVIYDVIGEVDYFKPGDMRVPVNTTISFLEKSGMEHRLWAPELWEGEKTLNPGGVFQWTFNETTGEETWITFLAYPPNNDSGAFYIQVL